ncbi:unnamed protein product [Brassicogethes aeneus]|uniref:N-acetyltransferase domain-containing protein n=1 Tax=Brassicogethes aeneus TaxID=1431903 RepID=A0A9P0BAB4_BRAAE|nr:unnamed protein product [Brassicogethes aeneus]
MVDSQANNGNGAITGMLKTGKKALYVFDKEGQHYQVSPKCVLDFYVPESRQRNGLGKQIFQHMLEKEETSPINMAIDRPSDKLINFLDKHYSLKEPIKQRNNFVVYNGFFPKENKNAGDSLNAKKLTANGLQYFANSQYYTEPVCRMEKINPNPPSAQLTTNIHNIQRATIPQTLNGAIGYTTQNSPYISQEYGYEKPQQFALPSQNIDPQNMQYNVNQQAHLQYQTTPKEVPSTHQYATMQSAQYQIPQYAQNQQNVLQQVPYDPQNQQVVQSLPAQALNQQLIPNMPMQNQQVIQNMPPQAQNQQGIQNMPQQLQSQQAQNQQIIQNMPSQEQNQQGIQNMPQQLQSQQVQNQQGIQNIPQQVQSQQFIQNMPQQLQNQQVISSRKDQVPYVPQKHTVVSNVPQPLEAQYQQVIQSMPQNLQQTPYEGQNQQLIHNVPNAQNVPVYQNRPGRRMYSTMSTRTPAPYYTDNQTYYTDDPASTVTVPNANIQVAPAHQMYNEQQQTPPEAYGLPNRPKEILHPSNHPQQQTIPVAQAKSQPITIAENIQNAPVAYSQPNVNIQRSDAQVLMPQNIPIQQQPIYSQPDLGYITPQQVVSNINTQQQPVYANRNNGYLMNQIPVQSLQNINQQQQQMYMQNMPKNNQNISAIPSQYNGIGQPPSQVDQMTPQTQYYKNTTQRQENMVPQQTAKHKPANGQDPVIPQPTNANLNNQSQVEHHQEMVETQPTLDQNQEETSDDVSTQPKMDGIQDSKSSGKETVRNVNTNKRNINEEGGLRYGYPAQKPANQIASFI